MKVGIDIGGSHIAIGVVNDEGKIVEKSEKDIQSKQNAKKEILDYLEDTLNALTKKYEIEKIGIASPGNPKETKIKNIVNLGIDVIDFKKIQNKYKVPVKVINDAKAAGLAEKEYGSLKKVKDGVFLCLGTGIGGAVFLNNELLIPHKNPGFELGHMIIDKNGNQCNCGKRGCFETYCSMKKLKNDFAKIFEKMYNEIDINNAKQLKKLILENKEEPKIQRIIEEYIDNLIIGLSNIIDIFEPEAISLGGSFVYFKDILYLPLQKKMEEKKYVFNKESPLPKIRLATFKNDSGIIGATLI